MPLNLRWEDSAKGRVVKLVNGEGVEMPREPERNLIPPCAGGWHGCDQEDIKQLELKKRNIVYFVLGAEHICVLYAFKLSQGRYYLDKLLAALSTGQVKHLTFYITLHNLSTLAINAIVAFFAKYSDKNVWQSHHESTGDILVHKEKLCSYFNQTHRTKINGNSILLTGRSILRSVWLRERADIELIK